MAVRQNGASARCAISISEGGKGMYALQVKTPASPEWVQLSTYTDREMAERLLDRLVSEAESGWEYRLVSV